MPRYSMMFDLMIGKKSIENGAFQNIVSALKQQNAWKVHKITTATLSNKCLLPWSIAIRETVDPIELPTFKVRLVPGATVSREYFKSSLRWEILALFDNIVREEAYIIWQHVVVDWGRRWHDCTSSIVIVANDISSGRVSEGWSER